MLKEAAVALVREYYEACSRLSEYPGCAAEGIAVRLKNALDYGKRLEERRD